MPNTNNKAFTLVELLVVVLIIGILTAVAIPMYQSAVDKTHWSTLLPTARALKNAEEAHLMATNVYTDNEDALDVAATQGDATYQLQMPDSAARYVIRGSTSKLPNVRLAQYLDENAAMAGQLHCEAKTGDERANKLCEKLLMGQELTTTDDGYTSYLLNQEVDKATCDSVSRSWSSSKTKCYKDTATRCADLGMGVVSGREDQCGYTNTSGKTIGEEGLCIANSGNYACNGGIVEKGGICLAEAGSYLGCSYNMIVRDGGVCQVDTGNHGCTRIIVNEGGICRGTSGDACYGSTFNAGGICIGEAIGNYARGCDQAIINSGAKCIAKTRGACNATYNGTGCCEGQYCPASAPKCQD